MLKLHCLLLFQSVSTHPVEVMEFVMLTLNNHIYPNATAPKVILAPTVERIKVLKMYSKKVTDYLFFMLKKNQENLSVLYLDYY